MRVCVVGGAGFLGSHVVERLCLAGHQVSVIDDLSTGKREFVYPGATLHRVDITDYRISLCDLFLNVDWVMNYAAMPFIPVCYNRPIEAMNVNTMGALRVIEEAHIVGVQRILQVSSAEVYGNKAGSVDEGASLSPVSTYASSKSAIDTLCRYRFLERQIPVIVLRQFNCVGERETHPYVIPEIISQIHNAVPDEGKITINLGNNTQRDFLYAGDAADMAIDILAEGELGQAYNLGSETTTHVYAIAETICSIMRPNHSLSISLDEKKIRPVDIWHLLSDNSKIYDSIDTRPQVTLREALEKTVDYYYKNGNTWGWDR